jgi:hypothetical protein
MILAAQKSRLEALRVPVSSMIHPKIEVKPDLSDEKATLRTRSSEAEQPSEGDIVIVIAFI